ncbi:MAG: CPBP family intramembrane metalloprotease [Cyclobacteriaceae bacterium]|nr:CPBP family intramembrane metalloprotease [Cyclobacteriaceae bacterium]
MVGILVQLIISALLLWVVEQKNLTALGIFPAGLRVRQFILGFVVAGSLCAVAQLFYSSFTHSLWKINPFYSSQVLLKSIGLDLKSVLFEELIFRGALLYILIQKIGSRKAILLSAVAFGIYHWFSSNAWSNPVMMIYVFTSTGIMGLVWAFAFSRTKSMALPIGLHVGWNLFYNSVFSNGPWGDILLVLEQTEDSMQLTGVISLINFIMSTVLVPLFIWFVVRKTKDGDTSGTPFN